MKVKSFFNISIINTIRFNLRYFGKNGLRFPVIIAKNIILKNMRGRVQLESYKTGNVQIGFDGTGICDVRKQRGIWYVAGNIFLGENIKIAAGVKISIGESATLKIKRESSININSQIICMDEINIGEKVIVSWDDLIMDSDFHAIKEHSILNDLSKKIYIDNEVWIGCRTIILKGVHVPEGSVVAAGSIVTGKYEEKNCLICSNGIKKHNISWVR